MKSMQFFSLFLKTNFLIVALISSNSLFGSLHKKASKPQSGHSYSGVKKLFAILCTAAVFTSPQVVVCAQQKPVSQPCPYVYINGVSMPMCIDSEELFRDPMAVMQRAKAKSNYFLSLIAAVQQAEREKEEEESRSK